MRDPELAQRLSPPASALSTARMEADALGARWAAAMQLGDFEAAFAASDAVLRLRDRAGRDDAREPYHRRWVWDGSPLAGRRVLVRCYHGLGDTLQFCRFLAPLRAVAAEVTLEVQPELLGVLRGVAGVDLMLGFDPAAPLPPSEVDVEIMELAHALRLAPDTGPYLKAAPMPGAVGRVGFCWQSGAWDPERSVAVEALRPVMQGVRAVSLQRGLGVVPGLEDPLAGSMDVAATAALVAGLDAVVTVDTMVAHLAGALGRPVFLLLKHGADWRWGQEGVWYRGTRHYRQSACGDWSAAIRQLRCDLVGTLDGVSGS